jgi:hypothetical protein
MGPQAKWEYMKVIYERYQRTHGRKAKGQILDEFCQTYGCHRKHALRVLNGRSPGERRPVRKHGGSPYRSGRLLSILEAVWAASGYLCGQRLKPALAIWMPAIRRRMQSTPEEERLLLAMGSATIDRYLKAARQRIGRRIYGMTRPGALLKHHIPIKTDSWDVDRPGFTEVDLVSHSGDSAEGDFAHTLDQTDILTGWVERRCVLGKGQAGVLLALDDMRRELPFDLLGLDSDNGSEFINHHLWNYCQKEPKVQFTRGRPYKKDDNAHIEQKNWTHVRKLLGYSRFDTQRAIDAINDLYRHELRWFQNFFQPSMKLLAKVRVGSQLRRRYDMPRTPLERVIASGRGRVDKIEELKQLRERMDPFALSQAIESQLTRIWAMRSQAPRPRGHGWLPSYRWNTHVEGPLMLPDQKSGLEPYARIWRSDNEHQAR